MNEFYSLMGEHNILCTNNIIHFENSYKFFMNLVKEIEKL